MTACLQKSALKFSISHFVPGFFTETYSVQEKDNQPCSAENQQVSMTTKDNTGFTGRLQTESSDIIWFTVMLYVTCFYSLWYMFSPVWWVCHRQNN